MRGVFAQNRPKTGLFGGFEGETGQASATQALPKNKILNMERATKNRAVRQIGFLENTFLGQAGGMFWPREALGQLGPRRFPVPFTPPSWQIGAFLRLIKAISGDSNVSGQVLELFSHFGFEKQWLRAGHTQHPHIRGQV